MEFEHIGRVWREEATGQLRRTRTEELSAAMGRAARYNAGVRRRLGISSLVIAVPLVLTFSYMAVRAPNAAALAGAVILAVLAAVVFFWYRRISHATVDAMLPVRQALEAEVATLHLLGRFGQRANRARVVLFLGTMLFVAGHLAATPAATAAVQRSWMLALLLIFVLIELLIRVGRQRTPSYTRELERELESWLDGLAGLDAFDRPGGSGPDVRSDRGGDSS